MEAPSSTTAERQNIIAQYDDDETKYVNAAKLKARHLRGFKLRQERQWLQKRKAAQYKRVNGLHEMKKELRGWFEFLDKDSSGEITVDELEDPLISMGLAKNRLEVDELVEKVDLDGSGSIGFNEFMDIILAKDEEGENPIVQVYQAMAQGKLGDKSLHIETLITAYRRRLLMTGLLSRAKNKSECDDEQLAEVEKLQHHVNALEISMRHGEEARAREHEKEVQIHIEEAKQKKLEAQVLGVDGQLIQRRERLMQRERARDANRVRHQFHMNDYEVFHKRGTAQLSSTQSPAALLGPYSLKSEAYTFGRPAQSLDRGQAGIFSSSGSIANSTSRKTSKYSRRSRTKMGLQKPKGPPKVGTVGVPGLFGSRNEGKPSFSLSSSSPALGDDVNRSPTMRRGGELQIFTYGPGSPFPHANIETDNRSRDSPEASVAKSHSQPRFVQSMGSSSGRVPRQLKGAIQRQHHYAKVDVETGVDVERRMARGEPTARYLRSQYGLSYGRFGYSNEDPDSKTRMKKTKKMQQTSGANYIPSDGLVPPKWQKDKTLRSGQRGTVTHCNGL